MALTPKNLKPGAEQYESFRSPMTKKTMVQYDFRDFDGELFSCIRSTLEACRNARNIWMERRM